MKFFLAHIGPKKLQVLMSCNILVIQPLITKKKPFFPSKPDKIIHHYTNSAFCDSFLQTSSLPYQSDYPKHKPVGLNIERILFYPTKLQTVKCVIFAFDFFVSNLLSRFFLKTFEINYFLLATLLWYSFSFKKLHT